MSSEDMDGLREVQRYMAMAQSIADGGDPGFRIGPARAKAANKVSIIAGLLACQKATQQDGIARIADYYSGGGELWTAGNSIEVLSPSHGHIHLAGMALHLLAAVRMGGGPLLDKVAGAWRLWYAAGRGCGYRDERGRWVRLTAGSRGRDMRGKTLADFPTNSCADKVHEGLSRGGDFRRAAERYDVAIPLLQEAIREGVVAAALNIGGDISPLTGRFGYTMTSHGDDYYTRMGHTDGMLSPLYGAGRVNGVTVLRWDPDAARETGERFLRGEPVEA